MNAPLSARGSGVKCLRALTALFMRGFVFEQEHSTRYTAIKSTKLALSKCLKGQNNKEEGVKQFLPEMHLFISCFLVYFFM